MWKNSLQLTNTVKDGTFISQFKKFFPISYILNFMIYPENFSFPQFFSEAIILSDEGNKCLDLIKSQPDKINKSDLNGIMFRTFFHHEILIDINNSDVDALTKYLTEALVNKTVLLPWVYENTLYNKFFELFPTRTDHLSYEDTLKLVDNTPQGVFQMGNYLFGPFGIIKSLESRLLKPTLNPLLWHCSDPSCMSTHTVRLTSGKGASYEAQKILYRELQREKGPPSEWDEFYRLSVLSSDFYYDTYNTSTLPFLFINGFSRNEINKIINYLIPRNIQELRTEIPSTHTKYQLIKGHPSKIVESLDLDEAFQLLLYLKDCDLIEAAELLIEDNSIQIPSTETRSPMVTHQRSGHLTVFATASKNGVRFTPRSTEHSLSNLKRLIIDLYDNDENRETLNWNLRHIEGNDTLFKLDLYIKSTDPHEIIRQLILTNQDILESSFSYLKYGHFSIPIKKLDEDKLIEKILWKLGFDSPGQIFDHNTFWMRMEKFSDDAAKCNEYTEPECEEVRGSGVNYFVSLEQILDSSLSFLTWMLLSDHTNDTRFTFNLDSARKLMCKEFNEYQKSSGVEGDDFLKFNAEGINTLYPLIQGFKILADICSNIINGDQKGLLKEENQLPGYERHQKVLSFPFKHKMFLLDIKTHDRDSMLEYLYSITTKLTQSNAPNIRNRLGHNRPDFPKKEEIQVSCNVIRDLVRSMETKGYVPQIYHPKQILSDNYGRVKGIYLNYRGAEITLFYGDEFNLIDLPNINKPQIIVPSVRLGDSSEFIRFNFQEQSDFVSLWSDWPKRLYRA